MTNDIEMEDFPETKFKKLPSNNDVCIDIPPNNRTKPININIVNQSSNTIISNRESISEETPCCSCLFGFIMGLLCNVFSICCVCCAEHPGYYILGCIFPSLILTAIIIVFLFPLFLPVLLIFS